jgi:hypothetical protein
MLYAAVSRHFSEIERRRFYDAIESSDKNEKEM